MIETLALSIVILLIAGVLFGIKIICKRGGKFASMHIHDSKFMQEKGIKCVIEQDTDAQKKHSRIKEHSK